MPSLISRSGTEDGASVLLSDELSETEYDASELREETEDEAPEQLAAQGMPEMTQRQKLTLFDHLLMTNKLSTN